MAIVITMILWMVVVYLENEKLVNYEAVNSVYGVCEDGRFYFSFLGFGSTDMVPENYGASLNVFLFFNS